MLAGTHSHGQGHATVFAQLVHEWLGVPFEIDPLHAGRHRARCRSAAAPTARAARSSAATRCKAASEAIIEKGKPMAAAMMEADAADIEFKDGAFRVVGTDKVIPLTDVAKASYAPMGPLTEKFGVGLEATGSYSAPVRRAIPTARTSASSRSIRRPAR